MMIFHCSIRDLVGRNNLSPHTFVDEKRGRRIRRLFGDALLSYAPPKFITMYKGYGVPSENRYRVVLKIDADTTLAAIGGALRERVSRCCGGGEIPDHSITIDFEKGTVAFLVKPTYNDEASLPDFARHAAAHITRASA